MGFRYRDWVISAFNTDLPYNQFVQMQIAGDLIGPSSNGSYDHLVSLGFFGLGAQYYKNSDAAKAAADELDDRIDTLTRGFLGLTVSCARCHDHKFDPIPTQDYYSLAGIFQSSKLHNAPLCSPDDIRRYNDGQQRIKLADTEVKRFIAEEKSKAAESKVGQTAKYIETVWRYQTAMVNGQKPNTEKLANSAALNEFLLKRWIKFLDVKQKGKVDALEPWFSLKPIAANEKGSFDISGPVPPEVSKIATDFRDYLQGLLDIRNGVAAPERNQERQR